MIHIVGDVHACYHTLTKLVDKVLFADEDAEFVFVGDYVDRALNSKETVEYLIELQKKGAICLRGNHDNVINWLLSDHYMGNLREMVVGEPTYHKVVQWWMDNGLIPTLESYGVFEHLKSAGPYGQRAGGERIVEDFREKVPQEHKDFFNSLPLYWENDTHFACHGFMRPDEALPRSVRFMSSDRVDETLWSRFPKDNHTGAFIPIVTKWDKIGVFGHTPTTYYGSPTPIKFDKVRLIDTGSFLDGYLCAYCCQQDSHMLQAIDSRDLKREKS